MIDTTEVGLLRRQLEQARKVIADLRRLVTRMEVYAPRRHRVRVMRRRLVERGRAAA